MDALTNPYTPNAGADPQVMAGRSDQMASFDLLLARMARGRTEQSMIITGLRGVGKTALLGRFRDKALEHNWVVIELEISKNEDSAFRGEIAAKLRTALLELSPKARWSDRFRHAAAVLKSFTLQIDGSGSWVAGLDVDAAEGFADHANLALDLTDVLLATGQAASEAGRGVVLLIDEAQFLSRSQLEAVITALHKTVQRKLPVTVVATGLPQMAELVGDAKSYAERLFKFLAIGSLSADDTALALVEPARQQGAGFAEDALEAALTITEGYPFFIQELGYAVWTIAEHQLVTRADLLAALPVFEAKLDASFYRVRLDRVTTLQRAYLRAMAQLGPEPQKASEVATTMGRTSPNLAPTRAELINMGLLYTPEHGYAAFTVPHFDRFLMRAIPELVVPALKARSNRAVGCRPSGRAPE